MKILICFGTRPEAIKMAPICRELRIRKIPFKICVTAQHREMLDQVLDFFEISPDYDLDLMRQSQTLNDISSLIFSTIDGVLEAEKPNIVLVQGDTTTATMVALAAFHKKITVGHIEAGLRTYNKSSPFPEEVNRQIISKIADLHFAPTEIALSNLIKEQIERKNVFLTGNTIVDAVNWAQEKIRKIPESNEIGNLKGLLKEEKKLILLTVHRRENFGDGFERICEAIIELVKTEDVDIIYPVHLNPNINVAAREKLTGNSKIHLVAPVSYPSMIWLLQRADIIISDSGGIQEEAPAFNKPVLVTREITERLEGVQAGFSTMVGTDTKKILEQVKKLIYNPTNFSGKKNPYGDGKAGKKIVDILLQ